MNETQLIFRETIKYIVLFFCRSATRTHYTHVDMPLITMHTVRPISKSFAVNIQGVVAVFHNHTRAYGKRVTNPIIEYRL